MLRCKSIGLIKRSKTRPAQWTPLEIGVNILGRHVEKLDTLTMAQFVVDQTKSRACKSPTQS